MCTVFSVRVPLEIPDQWVGESCDHDRRDVHLSDTIVRLKAFNAKRKWRAVAAVVMLGARLGVKKRNRSASEGEQGQCGCEFVRFASENTVVMRFLYITYFPPSCPRGRRPPSQASLCLQLKIKLLQIKTFELCVPRIRLGVAYCLYPPAWVSQRTKIHSRLKRTGLNIAPRYFASLRLWHSHG